MEVFFDAAWGETLAGKIVLSVGCPGDVNHVGSGLPPNTKRELDELHLRKIDLADEVLILNVGGYVGESTARELDYARRSAKRVRWLEPPTEQWATGCDVVG